jgi:hypothetical protein
VDCLIERHSTPSQDKIFSTGEMVMIRAFLIALQNDQKLKE